MEIRVDPLIGTRLDGRYEIVGLLAVGGMATVYEGIDSRLDRPVAIKVMQPALAADPAFVTRFRHEATSAARLAHPNVVAVHDQGGGSHGEPVHLVMELVRGKTLRQLLDERTQLPAVEALDILEPVAAALAAAHASGIVHRDIKPENVLLGDDGRVRVADFGLARAIDGGQVTQAAGLLLGTVAYLSPEQVGSGSADTRSDVYACGILLFEMLTGRVPHHGDTPLSVAYQHLNVDVPPPSTLRAGIPPAVDQMVAATTSREPDLRLADGAALLTRVRQARATFGTTEGSRLTTVMPMPTRDTVMMPAPAPKPRKADKADRAEASPRPRRRWRRRLVLWLALLLACAVAAAGGWWLAAGRYVHAPKVTGLSATQAQAAIRHEHLKAREEASQFSDTVAKDQVLSQDPAPGKRVARDGTVVFRLSLGPQLFSVPTIPKGTRQAVAGDLLHKANLGIGTLVPTYDDTGVAKGLVIGTNPAAGTQQPRGTVVQLLVSNGPTPVAIVDVHGQSKDAALTALQGQGFKTSVKEQSDETIPEGYVISTSPEIGSQQVPGTTVTIVVSTGKPLVAVPYLIDAGVDDAVGQLHALGLTPQLADFFGGSTVSAQNPKAGTMVKPGSVVQLVVTP